MSKIISMFDEKYMKENYPGTVLEKQGISSLLEEIKEMNLEEAINFVKQIKTIYDDMIKEFYNPKSPYGIFRNGYKAVDVKDFRDFVKKNNVKDNSWIFIEGYVRIWGLLKKNTGNKSHEVISISNDFEDLIYKISKTDLSNTNFDGIYIITQEDTQYENINKVVSLNNIYAFMTGYVRKLIEEEDTRIRQIKKDLVAMVQNDIKDKKLMLEKYSLLQQLKDNLIEIVDYINSINFHTGYRGIETIKEIRVSSEKEIEKYISRKD